MEIFRHFLTLLSLLLLVLAGLQRMTTPFEKPRRFLVLALVSVCLGIFQSAYFLLPQVQRFNLILLLPLKLSFLPLWSCLTYIRSTSAQSIVTDRRLRILYLLTITEAAVHLLPLGAIGFTRAYSRPILDYLFFLQAIFFCLFFLTTHYLAFVCCRNRTRLNLPRLEQTAIGAAALIGTLALCSVLLPRIGIHMTFMHYLPQIVAAIFMASLAVRDLRQKSSSGQPAPADLPSAAGTRSDQTFEQMKALISDEKLYLNPKLRMSDVASRMHLSPNYLSRRVNEASSDGFNDIVNRMRVEYVIGKIEEKEFRNKTLISLATESGFNSKSTFNAAFKKITGQTPTEYIRAFHLGHSRQDA